MPLKKKALVNPFPGEAITGEEYGTGEAAEILGIPMWRLQKFLSSPAYRLSVFDQLGEGKGSRRMFSREGLYRIATAIILVRDGFSPKFVGSALKHLDEDEFQELDHETGAHVRPGISFERTSKRPRVDFFASGKPPEIKAEKVGPYYALDLSWIMDDVNNRIRERRIRREEKRRPSEKSTNDEAELLSGKDEFHGNLQTRKNMVDGLHRKWSAV